MKLIRRLLLLCLVLIGAFVALYAFAPWKAYLETRVIALLEEAGVQNVAFRIENINLHEVTLSNIALGKENPLILSSVTLEYSPREVMAGNLRHVVLSGLHLQAVEADDGWRFTGMDILPPRGESASAIDIPTLLNSLPFTSIKISDSDLQINGKSVQGTVPFSLVLSDTLSLKTLPAGITAGSNTISLGAFALDAARHLTDNQWNGNWTLASSNIGADSPVPPMSGEGTVEVESSHIDVAGKFMGADKAYKASVAGIMDVSDSSKNKFTLVSASFPFKQGTVSTRNVALKIPMTIPLTIRKVSMDDLLQSLTGQKVSATGTVSGAVPLILSKDGNYSFGKGSLKSDTSGQITMPGDVIPGDNEQVALVRQIMENLQYSLLSAGVSSAKDGKMTVSLHLEGHNPDVYNGRQVKLNINLTGDVLDIIRQNIMLFTTPEKLLEQGSHE